MHYKVLKERDCADFGYAELCQNEEKEHDYVVTISGEIVSRGNNLAQQTAVFLLIGNEPITEEHANTIRMIINCVKRNECCNDTDAIEVIRKAIQDLFQEIID